MNQQPLRILFVDDSHAAYELICDVLSETRYQSFQVDWSAKYVEALDWILHRGYDACLIDYYLNGRSGLDLIQEALAKGCKSPLIVVTGKGDLDLDLKVMRSGAADYLDKTDIRPTTLERCIRYAMERAKTLASLRESEERYRDLFENSTDLIQSVDTQGRYLYVNRAWHQALGYHAQEIPQLNMLDIVHPDHAAYCKQVLQTVLEGQEVSHVETIFRAKDGREVIVEGSLNRKLIPGQAPVTRAIFRDITQRKRTEQALKESEERLRIVVQSLPIFVFMTDRDGIVRLGEGKVVDLPGIGSASFTGKHIETILKLLLGDPLPAEPQAHLTRALQGQAGYFTTQFASLCFEINYAPLRDHNGEFIGVIGVTKDITSIKQAEAAERRQRLLFEALHDTATALNSTLLFEEILERILANVEKVIPHDAADIMMVEDGAAKIVGARGYEEKQLPAPTGEVKIADIPNLQKMVETRQLIIVPDTQQAPTWVDLPSTRWVRSYAGIPIQSEGKVVGFLNLSSKTPNFFTLEMTKYVQMFSNQIAIAVQNARRYEQAQELATLNERQRLARDLHDAVSQTLFSASVIAESLPRIAKDMPESVRLALTELHLLNRRALAEMRSLLLELRPKALVESKIEDLLRQLAETFSTRQRIDVDLKLIEGLNVPTDTKIMLYRISQEALNNIAKHAHATQVAIHLSKTDSSFMLAISDNGRGFDVSDTLPDNFGLSIMRERAKSIGGTFQITSHPGNGTRVIVQFPEHGLS